MCFIVVQADIVRDTARDMALVCVIFLLNVPFGGRVLGYSA